jgi:hypothetical protein
MRLQPNPKTPKVGAEAEKMVNLWPYKEVLVAHAKLELS